MCANFRSGLCIIRGVRFCLILKIFTRFNTLAACLYVFLAGYLILLILRNLSLDFSGLVFFRNRPCIFVCGYLLLILRNLLTGFFCIFLSSFRNRPDIFVCGHLVLVFRSLLTCFSGIFLSFRKLLTGFSGIFLIFQDFAVLSLAGIPYSINRDIILRSKSLFRNQFTSVLQKAPPQEKSVAVRHRNGKGIQKIGNDLTFSCGKDNRLIVIPVFIDKISFRPRIQGDGAKGLSVRQHPFFRKCLLFQRSEASGIVPGDENIRFCSRLCSRFCRLVSLTRYQSCICGNRDHSQNQRQRQEQ